MNIENIIQDACNSIISMQENEFKRKKTVTELTKIVNFITKQEQEIKKLKSKKYPNYDNDLENCIHRLKLHGYTLEDLNNNEFIEWLSTNITNQIKPRRITAQIISRLSMAYYSFRIDYDREPENYAELRSYHLNTEEVLTDKYKKDIQALEIEYLQ